MSDRMAKAFGVILWCETCGAECTGFGLQLLPLKEALEIAPANYVMHSDTEYNKHFYPSVHNKEQLRINGYHYAGIMPKE